MPSKLKKAIGAVKDQTSISLAKVASNNTCNLEVLILKATTHDVVPMDERYINEILQLVSSSKIYAAACARAIGKRISRTHNWIVALKSLMLVLKIFQNGDPYFPREVLHAMKRGVKILNLSSFRDDSNSNPWDFTAFVRTIALYLDERLECFLTGKLQRRSTHTKECITQQSRGPNEPVRDMKPSMLLDRISYWQRLLERAIATRPTGVAKTNRLVQICLYAIVQESFDLYKDISDGLALLLDSFFHLQYQNCVAAFQTCVKGTKQFEELSDFYSLCKSIGVGRISEYPSVQTISPELIDTLQEFLKDKSSFPAISKTSNRPALLLPTPRTSISDSHDGQSEFSATIEGCSEVGSCSTPLGDLISGVETGTSPGTSNDLEADPDQTDKESPRDCTSGVCETGSPNSLPTSNSMPDLLILGDLTEENEGKNAEEQSKEQNAKKLESIIYAKGWDIVLADVMTQTTQSSPNVANSSDASLETSNSLAQSTQMLSNVLNNVDTWPESSIPSGQALPNIFNNFDSFPQTSEYTTQHSPDVVDSYNHFPQTTESTMQHSPDITDNFNDFLEK